MQPATYANCPFVGTPPNETGHFLTVINPAEVFVGVGELDNANSPTLPVTPASYFVEEFE
jgi:hypothetical protein